MAITSETFAYLADLEAHNRKDWFEANRARYETHWKAAGLDLIDALGPQMAALDPPLVAEPRLNGSLRRINRDVRFSKDKSPYTARLHLVFWAGGQPTRWAGMHIVLNPLSIGYGAGAYGFDGAMLKRYRDQVLVPSRRDALLSALRSAGAVGSTLGEPDLVRLPRGYDATDEAARLLRYKSVVARTHGSEAEPGVLIGPGAADWALKITRAHLPLLRWLQEM
ncbi:MAG: DUF2461 domain-containing protein [Rhodobacteraceae bacterium]|nr:DUF2461 domain-containing protein [Paracoccaceae bacterium]